MSIKDWFDRNIRGRKYIIYILGQGYFVDGWITKDRYEAERFTEWRAYDMAR